MKTRLMPIILIVFIQSVHSQIYIPFPESNTTWVDGQFTTMIWPPQDTSYCYYKTGGDTLINGIQYTCIDRQEIENFCFIRQENGKVYLKYNAWTNDTSEYVLYDFTLITGDEIHLPMFGGGYYPAEVTWVDSILVGETYRKQIHITSWIEITFIEGIGAAQGFFYPYIPWVDSDGILDCISINDTIYSLTGDGSISTGNCWQTTSINETNSKDLVIYPNPVKDVVRVSGELNYYFELYTAGGSIMLTERANQLNLANLPDGIYYLKVFDDRHQLIGTKKLLKMEN